MASSSSTPEPEKLDEVEQLKVYLVQKYLGPGILPGESLPPTVRPENIPPAIRAFFPADTTRDPERESVVMQKMRAHIGILECSKFYRAFLDQMRSREMSDIFGRVLGSEEKVPMVIYGIGCIESCEGPRSQLALSLLMKKDFPWIGDIEVYDPIINGVESKVMADLGCTVLTVNEDCRRQVVKPTLFFMPHCKIELFKNLMLANWDFGERSKIALLGNSFSNYRNCFREVSWIGHKHRWLYVAARFTKEIPIDESDADYAAAFSKMSWHFFNVECGGVCSQSALW